MKLLNPSSPHPARAVQAWQILVGRAMNRQTSKIGGQIFNLDKSNCQNLETPAFVKIKDLTPESH